MPFPINARANGVVDPVSHRRWCPFSERGVTRLFSTPLLPGLLVCRTWVKKIRLGVRERRKFGTGGSCQKVIVAVGFLISAVIVNGDAPKASPAKNPHLYSKKRTVHAG